MAGLKSCLLALGMAVLIVFAFSGFCSAEEKQIEHWLCYYGKTFGPRFYSRFDLVVLDGTNHCPLKRNRKGSPLYLGYISLGEANLNGPFWSRDKSRPFLIHKNEFWDSWIVNLGDSEWQDIILNKAVPHIIEQGFDGIFLDTLDSALALASIDPDRFKNISADLVRLVGMIRAKFPGIKIAVNRGLPVLADLAQMVDFVLVEDLYSYYNDSSESYERVSNSTREILLEQVDKGLAANPLLTVLTLDYADSSQKKMIREAIAFSRSRGFIPYVSTYKLNQIFYYSFMY